MATPEELEKLRQAKDIAGGQEELSQAIKDRGLEDRFIDKFGKPQEVQSGTMDKGVEQTTEGVKGFKEGQVEIPGVNTQDKPKPTTINIKSTPKEEIKPEIEEATPEQLAKFEEDKLKFEEDKIKQEKDKLEEEKVKIEEEKVKIEEDPVIKSEQELVAEQKGYTFEKNSKGELLFTPKNLDEAIELFTEFGGNVAIEKNSKENIVGSKIFKTYSKYKNAPKDIYLQGLKNNEIGVSGPNWDRLVKMNGGEPTTAMLEAQEEWDKLQKINNNNGVSDIISGNEIKSNTDTLEETLSSLDNNYLDTIKNLYGELSTNYDNYKSGNEKLSTLNTSLTENSKQRDELQIEKRKVLDNVRKKFPTMTLGQQLVLAREQMDAIDDQLFGLQREFNADLSEYKFENEKNKGEFEYQAGLVENKMKLVESMYKNKRGDAVTFSQIQRQDKLLADQIERAKEGQKAAIIQGDKDAARDFAYDIVLAEAKQEMNGEFSFTTPEKGVVARQNKKTGEVEFIRSGGITDSVPTFRGGGKFTTEQSGARTNRHNNPTAFTTDVAKQAGLVEGVDYEEGDSFQGGVTAKILGDPIEITKKVIDSIGFFTQGGKPRWSYINDIFTPGKANEEWNAMTEDERTNIVGEMYKRETDNKFENFGAFIGGGEVPQFDSFQTSVLNKFDGSDIEKLAEDLGVNKNTARDMFNQFKGVQELSSQELLQADKLAIKIYGKRAGDKSENKEKIYNLMKENKTIDEIEDIIRLGGFGLEYTGNYKSAYENISTEFSKDIRENNQAVLEDKISEFGGNSEQVKSYLKKISRDSMETESSKKVKGYELLENSMIKIRKDLEEYDKKGGDTGVFVGRKEDILKAIGKISNTEVRKVANKIAKTIQTYRQSVSGAAFTESESEEYKAIFPSTTNVAALNFALIDSLLESNTISIDTAYGQQMGEGEYNDIFKGGEQLKIGVSAAGGQLDFVRNLTQEERNKILGKTDTLSKDDVPNVEGWKKRKKSGDNPFTINPFDDD